MSAIMIGHRRIQTRSFFLIGVVFVLILLFFASSSRLHDRINSFHAGKPAPQTTSPKTDDELAYPTFDYTYDNIGKSSSTTKEAARDPCIDVWLKDDGATPQHVPGTRVLVTGGAGFIGSNLVDKLVSLGYRVRVLDNLYTGFIRNVALQDDRIEFMLGDIMDPEVIKQAVEGVEYVFHLAAMSKVVPSVKDPDMARFCVEANALGTWNVLNSVREQGGIKKVIYAASSTYYGNKAPPHREDMAPNFLTPYAASKYEGELQMEMFDRLFQVPTISTRFFMVYGPRQPSTGAYAIVTGVFAKQAADGKQLTIEGDGSHYRDFIHVSDIVAGLILSQQSEDLHGNVVNLGTGTAFSVQDVANLVSSDQKHIDARKNDLEGTLADTCRMKRLLGYKAKADFKTEMSYMVKQTMEGNVFMQPWMTPNHALSAPHLLAPGTPVFNWPAKKDDLDAVLLAVQNVKSDSSENTRGRAITVLPFSVGDADTLIVTSILLNTVFSLVRFGQVSTYLVAAFDAQSFESCTTHNLPCFDARNLRAPQVLNQLMNRGYDVHLAQIGNSYVSPVSDGFAKIRKDSDSAEVLAASPHGDVYVRLTDRSRTRVAKWAENHDSFGPNDFFDPKAWPEEMSQNRITFDVEATRSSASPSSSINSPFDDDSSSLSSHRTTSGDSTQGQHGDSLGRDFTRRSLYSPSSDSDAEPEPDLSKTTTTASSSSKKASSAPHGVCDGRRFYVAVTSDDITGSASAGYALRRQNAESMKKALNSTGVWHLTECKDKLHCDIQQSVPQRWVANPPDLAEHGGMC